MQKPQQLVRAEQLVQQAERALHPSSFQTLSRVFLQLRQLQGLLSETALNIPLGTGAANCAAPSNAAYEPMQPVRPEVPLQHQIRPELILPHPPGAHQEMNGRVTEAAPRATFSPEPTTGPVEGLSVPLRRTNPDVQSDQANRDQTQDKRRTTAVVARLIPAEESVPNAIEGERTADQLAMRSDGYQPRPPKQQPGSRVSPMVQRETSTPPLQPKISSPHDLTSIQTVVAKAHSNKTFPPGSANTAPVVGTLSRTAKSGQLGLYPKGLRVNQRAEERPTPAFSAARRPEPQKSESAASEPPQKREQDESVPLHALDENVHRLAEQLEHLLRAEAQRHGIEI